MKTVSILSDTGSELLLDVLNQKIVRELVFSQHSIAELSRKLNIPPLKTWRRVRKLVEANMVEVARVDVVQNLEKKIYRATATQFVSREVLDIRPNDERLGRAFRTYREIQTQVMERMSAFSDIPEGTDPIDFSIYAAVKSYCQVFLDPGLGEKLRRLEHEISEFESDHKFPQTQR